MRLNNQQIAAIKQAARDTLDSGSTVTLFGSRLDDEARGGDIDLLVELPSEMTPEELVKRENRFLGRLYRLLDEQRIDVLIVPAGTPDDRMVVKNARRDGYILTRVGA